LGEGKGIKRGKLRGKRPVYLFLEVRHRDGRGKKGTNEARTKKKRARTGSC